MVSAGLTLIFGMMGVLNFAHASFYMLGAYFAYALQGVIGFWPAVARRCWWRWSAWWSSASSCAACTTTATRMSCC
jgi:branched-subunit amino acid ABC-type transport system permease component